MRTLEVVRFINKKKSTSRTCHFLGYSLVSWYSNKQNLIALSTAEAEYITAKLGCAQVIWMKQILSDFALTFSHVPIKCDNTRPLAYQRTPCNTLGPSI